MEICFQKNDVFAVRFFNDADKERLLDTVEALGIPVRDSFRRKGELVWPRATCTFAVDLSQRRFEYLAEPFVCAAMASSGVRFCSVPEFCRLAELGFPAHTYCPVFHVPHDGSTFPPELMSSVCIPEDEFLSYHETMCDTGMWEAVPLEYRVPFQSVYFAVSRLLCDVERFIGPEEVMERYGMGFCYERAYDGVKIKNVTDELKEKTLPYYRKHHKQLDDVCRKHERILLFDLHSYSDELVPQEQLRAGVETPDVCIGTHSRFTPAALVETVENRLDEAGLSFALNYPYSGCLIPNTVLSGEEGYDFIGVMLEFHKRTYCDENRKPIREKLSRHRELIRQIAADCVGLS